MTADDVAGAGRAALGGLKTEAQGAVHVAAVIDGGGRRIEAVSALFGAHLVHRGKETVGGLAVGLVHVGQESAGRSVIAADAVAVDIANGKIEAGGLTACGHGLTVGGGGGVKIGGAAEALLVAIAKVGERIGMTESGGAPIEREGLAHVARPLRLHGAVVGLGEEHLDAREAVGGGQAPAPRGGAKPGHRASDALARFIVREIKIGKDVGVLGHPTLGGGDVMALGLGEILFVLFKDAPEPESGLRGARLLGTAIEGNGGIRLDGGA